MIVHNYKSIFFFRLLFKNAEKNCLFTSLLPTDRMCTVGRQKQICVYEHKHCEFHKFPFVLVIKNLSTRSWHKSASVWTVFFPFVFKVFFTHANNLSVAFRFKKKKKNSFSFSFLSALQSPSVKSNLNGLFYFPHITQRPIVDLVRAVAYKIHKCIASSAVRSLTNLNRLIIGR